MTRVLTPDEMAPPGTPEWGRTITASKIPTILGLSPFQTASELWMTMSGLAQPEKLEGENLEWGHIGEESLIQWWLHKNPGWRASPVRKGSREVAYTNDSLPFANQATLDARAVRGRRFRILECKTTDWADEWADDDLPGWVHTQALAQMGISGITSASVIRQLHSTVPVIYDLQFEQDLWSGIVDQVHAFTQTLGNAEPPMPPTDLIDALKAQRVTLPSGKDLDTVEIEEDNHHVQEIRRLNRIIAELEDDRDQEEQMLLASAPCKRIKLGGKSITRHTSGRFSEKRVPEEARHLLMDPAVHTPKLDPAKFKSKYPDVAAAATGDDTITINIKED